MQRVYVQSLMKDGMPCWMDHLGGGLQDRRPPAEAKHYSNPASRNLACGRCRPRIKSKLIRASSGVRSATKQKQPFPSSIRFNWERTADPTTNTHPEIQKRNHALPLPDKGTVACIMIQRPVHPQNEKLERSVVSTKVWRTRTNGSASNACACTQGHTTRAWMVAGAAAAGRQVRVPK